jgi:hypothetical protein
VAAGWIDAFASARTVGGQDALRFMLVGQPEGRFRSSFAGIIHGADVNK